MARKKKAQVIEFSVSKVKEYPPEKLLKDLTGTENVNDVLLVAFVEDEMFISHTGLTRQQMSMAFMDLMKLIVESD